MAFNSVKWEITSKCNLKCKHCFLSKVGLLDIPINEAKLIVDRLKKIGTKEIMFTSKEPFMYDDFFELLKYCRIQGIRIGIITNGTLLDEEKIENLYHLGISSIAISLDGWEEKSNDLIRGKGVFQKVKNVLDIFKIKNKESNKYIDISIFTLITSTNIKEIDTMADFYNLFPDFKVSFGIVDSFGSAKDNKGIKVRWSTNKYFEDKFYTQISKMKAHVLLRDKSYYESIYLNFTRGFNLVTIPMHCGINNNTFSILSDGTMCKCLPLLDESCKVKFKVHYKELMAKSHFGVSSKDIFFDNEEFDYKNNGVCKACSIKDNCRLCYMATSSIEKINEQIYICELFMNSIEKEIQGFFNNEFGVKISQHVIISNDGKKVDCLQNDGSIIEFEANEDETKFILELIENGECFSRDIKSNNRENIFRNLLYRGTIVKVWRENSNNE